MLALKLGLVAASVLGATLASRRWGHAAGSLLAGLPMIIVPITAILLVDQPPERVRAIALASLLVACDLPPLAATALVLVTWARRRRRAQPSHWRGPEGEPTEIVVSRGD